MPSYNTAVITKKGIALSTKALSGQEMRFTKAAIGDGEYNELENLENITELRSVKQEKEFNSWEIKDEKHIILQSVFENRDLDTGYKIKEFGIYAEDPDEGEILYLICTAVKGQEDTMPAYSENGLVTITMETSVSVSSTQNIIIESTSGGYALNEDLKKLEKKVDDHIEEADQKYALKSELSSGISGIVFAEGTLSSEANTVENQAEYKCLQKTTESENVIFTAQTDKAKFGAYSCIIRAKVSDNSKSNAILEIEAAYQGNERKVLRTVTITPDMFKSADTFQSLGFIFDFSGEKSEERKLEIKGTIKQIEGPVTLTIDYVIINYAITAIYAIV